MPSHGKSHAELHRDAHAHLLSIGRSVLDEAHQFADRHSENVTKLMVVVAVSVLFKKNPKSLEEFGEHFVNHFGEEFPMSAARTELYYWYDRKRKQRDK